MNVGIVTIHNGINHGGFLQVYCLQEIIRHFGHNVTVINYRNNESEKLERQYFLGYFPKRPKQFFIWTQNFLKYLKFKFAHFVYLKTSKRIYKISDANINNEDLLIYGSDEIWNIRNPLIGRDLNYFGHEIKRINKVTYAISLGSVTSEEEFPCDIISCMNEFQCISLRDENSVRILKELGLTAIKVLDPTFLYAIPLKMKNKNADIIIYANPFNSQQVNHVNKSIKTTKLKTTAIGYWHDWCDNNHVSIGINEWLSYFKNAKFVITNTYHGLIYSIIYKKIFFVVINPGKSNKILDLINDLGLSSRIIDESIPLNFDQKIDYSEVYSRLELMKNYSLAYIKSILK